MHYKNGREAKNGDKIMVFPDYGTAYIGVMYDAVTAHDQCNGRVALISTFDPVVNLLEAVHIDDVKELISSGNDARTSSRAKLEALSDTSKRGT